SPRKCLRGDASCRSPLGRVTPMGWAPDPAFPQGLSLRHAPPGYKGRRRNRPGEANGESLCCCEQDLSPAVPCRFPLERIFELRARALPCYREERVAAFLLPPGLGVQPGIAPDRS